MITNPKSLAELSLGVTINYLTERRNMNKNASKNIINWIFMKTQFCKNFTKFKILMIFGFIQKY